MNKSRLWAYLHIIMVLFILSALSIGCPAWAVTYSTVACEDLFANLGSKSVVYKSEVLLNLGQLMIYEGSLTF